VAALVLLGAVGADAAGAHGLAFYLLLAAVVVIAHGALDAYGKLVELPGSARGLGAARLQATLYAVALLLALVAAAVRGPLLGAGEVPALGLSAVAGALAVLVVQAGLRLARGV